MSLLPLFLNAAYLLLLAALSPLLGYRGLVHRKYRDGWGQKLCGNLPPRTSDRPRVWFHAVSVGEVLQLQTVLREFTHSRPDCEILITTTTPTGLAVAREKFPQHAVCYFPLDFSWTVRRAICRAQPAAIALVELELWPNFILEAARRRIPLALINGRISEKSFRGYQRIRPLLRKLLHCFDVLAVQSHPYAERLLALGAPTERITVTGSVKFDHVQADRNNPRTRELRQSFGVAEDETVFIAGSTHAPEEQAALDCYAALAAEFEKLRLVLVPRHQQRFDEVAQLVLRRGLPLLRRSELPRASCVGENTRLGASRAGAAVSDRPGGDAAGCGRPVLLLDTLGELAACWGLADIAFVGGSLTRRGGQNMIEPAAYGAAVLFGPNTQNFRDVVELLLSAGAAQVVADAGQLQVAVRRLLADPAWARRQGKLAQQLVCAQQGATAQTVRLLKGLLLPDSSAGTCRAA